MAPGTCHRHLSRPFSRRARWGAEAHRDGATRARRRCARSRSGRGGAAV